MSAAYTPGLLVTPSAVISRLRRLPVSGEVLVREGVPRYAGRPAKVCRP